MMAAGKGAAKATILAELVRHGTITQAQADAISKKFDDFKSQRWMLTRVQLKSSSS